MTNIQHLHETLLIIMDEIDRVCENNNINYTLTGGSLIGAVRHFGFIPWDDDMDIALTRDNYNKLIQCKDQFGKEFTLQTYESDPNYYYGYAKLLLNGTISVEMGHENTKYKKGVFIDIFPLDNVPSNIFRRKKQKTINYFFQKISRQKMGISDNPNWTKKEKYVFCTINCIAKLFPRKTIIRILEYNMTFGNNTFENNITNLSGMYGYEKETAKIDWFLKYEKVSFEDRKYYVIVDRDKYLRKIYGNYMEIPPIEKRHTHEFQTLDFGDF